MSNNSTSISNNPPSSSSSSSSSTSTSNDAIPDPLTWPLHHQYPNVPFSVIEKRLKIVTVGDSITQQGFMTNGWVSQLANNYARKADIINRGYSGYNTRFVLDVVKQLLINKQWPYDPSSTDKVLVTLFLGANDACSPYGYSRHQHIPLDEYKENLKLLANLLTNNGESSSISLIIITPPMIDPDRWGSISRSKYNLHFTPWSRKIELTKQYADAAINVAEQLKVPFINLWELTTVRSSNDLDTDGNNSFLSDGLHLSEKGNTVLFNAVMAIIEKQFPKLMPLSNDLPLDAPLWDYFQESFHQHIAATTKK